MRLLSPLIHFCYIQPFSLNISLNLNLSHAYSNILIYSYSNREAAWKSRTSLEKVGGDNAKQNLLFNFTGISGLWKLNLNPLSQPSGFLWIMCHSPVCRNFSLPYPLSHPLGVWLHSGHQKIAEGIEMGSFTPCILIQATDQQKAGSPGCEEKFWVTLPHTEWRSLSSMTAGNYGAPSQSRGCLTEHRTTQPPIPLNICGLNFSFVS